MGVDTKTDHTADFTKYMRPGWLGRDDVRLTWADYLEKEDNIVTGNDLDIRMKWKNNVEVNNVGIRVELIGDDDKPFATAVYYDVFSGKSGEEGETLFCLDPYDETIDLDCVRGIDITIKREKEEHVLNWRNNSWGNIKI